MAEKNFALRTDEETIAQFKEIADKDNKIRPILTDWSFYIHKFYFSAGL